jgi:antitoxin (DNA-binding transcriptional repressor) of toxin-antitoxin stability system
MRAKKHTVKGKRRKPSELAASGAQQSGLSVSVRGLRKDWRRVKAMVTRGAKVVVTDNGLPIMQLVPIDQPVITQFDWVAHLQDIREIAGDRSTGTNSVIEERALHKG